jgi:hypothetical protein
MTMTMTTIVKSDVVRWEESQIVREFKQQQELQLEFFRKLPEEDQLALLEIMKSETFEEEEEVMFEEEVEGAGGVELPEDSIFLEDDWGTQMEDEEGAQEVILEEEEREDSFLLESEWGACQVEEEEVARKMRVLDVRRRELCLPEELREEVRLLLYAQRKKKNSSFLLK